MPRHYFANPLILQELRRKDFGLVTIHLDKRVSHKKQILSFEPSNLKRINVCSFLNKHFLICVHA